MGIQWSSQLKKSVKTFMLPKNDETCGWINDLPSRTNIKTISGKSSYDWIVVGAGFTGLSAARQLGNLHPNKKITIVDAQLAGEGASSRNSGYLVDTTLNDGFISNKSLNGFKEKNELYCLGIDSVKNFISQYQVDCDWNECGKYFASSKLSDEKKLVKFSEMLSSLNIENSVFYKNDLTARLGTNFYNIAVYTEGGILLHPGKLVRAMVDSLPENVTLFENSPLLKWEKNSGTINCKFNNGEISASSIIFCTNGFLSSLGIEKSYSFPLVLTASMTRKLTEKEYLMLGAPNEWGVLSARSMGATVRMTKDRRILIRNTVEVPNQNNNSKDNVKKIINLHKLGIHKRFPSLPTNIIESSWSGIVCRSGNAAQIFKKIEHNIYAAGCYNGSGIGTGTLFGEQIAIKACNESSKEIDLIEKNKKPNWLPPQPFLNWGIKARFLKDNFFAKSEI